MRFSAEEGETVELDLGAERDHADDVGRAASRQHLERLLRRLLEADGFEGMMHAAFGHLDDLGDGIALLRVDDIGGTEMLCEVELRADCVDRDDAARAGDRRAIDGGQTDARRSRLRRTVSPGRTFDV